MRAVRAATARALLGRLTVDGRGGTLLLIGLIDSIGTGLYLAGAAVFFTRVVHLGAAEVGVGLSVAGVLGLAAQPLIGWTADRLGPRRMLIALHLWRAAGFAAYVFTDTFAMFVVVAALLGIGEQAAMPIYQAFVERVVGTRRRVAMMARLRSVFNAGFTLGALLATAAVGTGSRLGFDAIMLGNAATFVVAAALLTRVRLAPRPAGDGAGAVRAAPARLRAIRDGRYVAVAAVNGALALHISLLAVAMPLWVTLHTAAPASLIGLLLVLNTVTAVVAQVRVARSSEALAGSIVALRRAGWALALSCAIFALAPLWDAVALTVVTLFLGVAALTAGELLQSAGGWGLSYLLAPGHARAEYLATFNLGASLQFVLGPTLVTVGVVDNGSLGWLALVGVFVVASWAVRPLALRAAQRPALAAEAPARDGRRSASYQAAPSEVAG